MKSVIRWAVQNSPAMNVLMVAVVAVGAVSLFSLRREQFPEFDLEIILVSVPYPGASPDEVEEAICQRIEEAVQPIDGIKKQTAVAQEGSGHVILELEADVPDVQKILNEVRSEVDRIPSFPVLAEDPEIKQLTLRRPAIRVGVIGPDSSAVDAQRKLRDVAERVRDDLLQLPAVSQANLMGAPEFQIDIEISETTLRKYGLTLQEVARIVRSQNLELPGGRMKSESQEVLLRGKNKRLVGEEIESIPLVTQRNGVVLTIGDLGVVRDEFADETAISSINGRPGLVISVDRTSGEDLLAVTEGVHEFLASKVMPPGYELEAWGDESVDVRDRLELLSRNGLQGLVLVLLVLAAFLEFRLAVWVALGIPIAVLGAAAVLLFTGNTLNMLTMFAFLMALGIVVDDAIVIGENIYTHRERGKNPVQAAIDGTVEVLPSVAASVTTTVIAFVPMMYVSGVMGKFFAVLPLAVIAMLVISLIESTLVLPCHLAHIRGPASQQSGMSRLMRRFWFTLPRAVRWTIGELFGVFRWASRLFEVFNRQVGRFLEWVIHQVYVPFLTWSLHNRGVVTGTAVAILILAVGLVGSGATPWVFFPKLDGNAIEGKITYPDGTPSHVADAATRKIEQAIYRVNERYAQLGAPILRSSHRAVGEVQSEGPGGPQERSAGSHVGAVNVELVETGRRDVTSEQLVIDWRKEAGEFPGAESVTFATRSFGPTAPPIEFKLLARSDHMQELEEAVEAAKEQLRAYPGIFDVADDSKPGKWEYQIKVKPNARSMGIPLAELAETVRASYYGEEVMRLQRGRHEVKLMVRYPPEERNSFANFEQIRVRAGDRVERPLTELANVAVERGYSEINRVNQLRSITISADVNESQGNASATVQDMQANVMPDLFAKYPSVSVRWEGQQEQDTESVSSLFRGFLIAIAAMFVLLTLEFRSYVQPLLILSIIPFGIIGAVMGHAVMGLPLTLFSVLGMVALTGVVVNDSIVLIDFINTRVRDGVPLNEALVDAGRRRFRPVLLTSLTTVAGLLPILTETSFQAQILIPMATSLCFGLSISTILVLLLVPTTYSFYANILAFMQPGSVVFENADEEHGNGQPVAEAPRREERDRILTHTP